MRTTAARVMSLLVNREISRFPYKERPHMPSSPTTPGRAGTRVGVPVRIAFRNTQNVGARHFRGSIAWPARSPETLRRHPRGSRRMTWGRCGSLRLHRKGLAPSTPCRSPGARMLTWPGWRALVAEIPRARRTVPIPVVSLSGARRHDGVRRSRRRAAGWGAPLDKTNVMHRCGSCHKRKTNARARRMAL